MNCQSNQGPVSNTLKWLQRFSIHNADIVNLPLILLNNDFHLINQRICIPLSAGHRGLTSKQRPIQTQRTFTLVWREILVAAAHGQTVLLPNNLADTYFERHVQVADHPPDDRGLLGVLLSEKGDICLYGIKQLCTDRRHSPEMAGTVGPAEIVGELLHLDPG